MLVIRSMIAVDASWTRRRPGPGARPSRRAADHTSRRSADAERSHEPIGLSSVTIAPERQTRSTLAASGRREGGKVMATDQGKAAPSGSDAAWRSSLLEDDIIR